MYVCMSVHLSVRMSPNKSDFTLIQAVSMSTSGCSCIIYCSERFKEICNGSVKVPGIVMMKDVAIAKSEFMDGEKAITKIQDWQHDDVMFEYCALPEVKRIFYLGSQRDAIFL